MLEVYKDRKSQSIAEFHQIFGTTVMCFFRYRELKRQVVSEQ